MTEWLSVAEAARRYRVSDKGIRNWIKAGLLTPEKRRLNGKLQYAIDPAALEKVMSERNMIAVPIRTKDEQAMEHIAHLEKRLADVERRLSLLEAQRYAEVEYSIPNVPAPLVQPEDTMEIRAFAVLHNLHINQVRTVVGNVEHINQVGMHEVWKAYQGVKRFHKCDLCPHET